MDKVIRRIDFTRARGADARELLRRQWLATNGLGGYASGTISGSVTWRYHGLLIARSEERRVGQERRPRWSPYH